VAEREREQLLEAARSLIRQHGVEAGYFVSLAARLPGLMPEQRERLLALAEEIATQQGFNWSLHRSTDLLHHLFGGRSLRSGFRWRGPSVLAHLHSLAVTMSQKSSSAQSRQNGPQALTVDRKTKR
jgi:hypothetical protein